MNQLKNENVLPGVKGRDLKNHSIIKTQKFIKDIKQEQKEIHPFPKIHKKITL